MKKVVFITGVAGFLGSHLARHHLQQGDEVWGVDNFSSSKEDSDHLRVLQDHGNFNFKRGDICEINSWRSYTKYDVIYNFACPASPPVYQKIPVETMMTCTLGTKNVLDLARKHEAILVHASTSEIYGDPITSPQREDDKGNVNSYGPRACYDEGKRAAEALCYDYKNTFGVDARMVRIFNTFGPHMDPFDGRVVSNFIRQALRNEPFTIYGHGQQTRSFCYVDDLIRGIAALGALEKNPNTPINLGNPEEFTIDGLAAMIAGKLDNAKDRPQGRCDYHKMPTDDPRQRKPDITLARNLLKWEPRVQLSEGLDKTIEYFKRVL